MAKEHAKTKQAGRSGERSPGKIKAGSEALLSASELAVAESQSTLVWMLDLFGHTDKWCIPGDDLGTTFLSAGAVLLVGAVTGDRTPETARAIQV